MVDEIKVSNDDVIVIWEDFSIRVGISKSNKNNREPYSVKIRND